MNSADVPIVVAVIAGALTVLGTVVTQALSRRADREAASQEARRDRKTEVYESYMEFWFWVLMHRALGKDPPTPEESQAWFVEFTQRCIPCQCCGSECTVTPKSLPTGRSRAVIVS